jgi:hypothetical protein
MTPACLSLTLVVSAAVLITGTAAAQPFSMQGQVSTWFTLNDTDPSTPSVGVRYLPALSFEHQLPESRLVDGEIAINAYGFGESPGWDELDTTGRLKVYRGWGRFKTSRFEGRVGLQKINFGSALLLRPLRWFDSVDPRDPLQITEGVYGLLVREYFPRNFTVWAWGLYGNEHLKGLEFSPTRERTPEYGGRFQAPLSKGEIAFTTHHRRADLSKGLTSVGAGEDPVAREHRYGLDGKWDVGIGLWFEAAAIRQTRTALPSAESGALTIGADYTFAIGNGLRVLGEYFVQETSREMFGEPVSTRFSAVSLNYQLGLLDSLSAILYVDTTRTDVYRFVNWQRTYDQWQFYVMGFWNPRQLAIVSQSATSVGRNPLSGRGVQIMAVFNHATGKKSARAPSYHLDTLR